MQRMSRVLFGGAALGALAVSAGLALAAPVTTTGRPLAPAIGFARPFNTYLLVWAEDKGLGSGLDIYAARTTASGIVVGAEIPVVVAKGDQSDPALVFSERINDYLVMFTTDGQASTTPENTPGIPPPIGGTPGLPTPPPPPIPFGSDFDSDFGAVEDFAVVEAPGGLQGIPAEPDQPIPPTPGPTALPGTPGVPPPVTATGQRDIYGTWLTASGQRVSSIFAVIASPADDTYPALASFRRGCCDERFVLVWREVTGTTVRLSNYEFLGGPGYFLVYDSAKGNIAGGLDQSRPSVAVEDSGEYLVAWAESAPGGDNRDLFGRRLNYNAWPVGPIIKLMDGPADQVYPSLGAIRNGGGYLLAWEERTLGGPPDIRTRRLNRNGIPIGAAYTLAGGAPYSFAPTLPSATDRATLLMAWLDRNAASDISIIGAEISRSGQRLGPERILVQGGTGPGGITPVPPPGFPTPPPPPIP
jgi:hypothetical protein